MVSSSTVSAPGKVFLAGGYLVLDRAYTALVFGLSARIHVIVSPLTSGEKGRINVRSPQFRDAEWHYSCDVLDGERGVQVSQLKQTDGDQSRNKFVETTISFLLSYASVHGVTDIAPSSICILADDDYYSHAHTATKCHSNPDSRFHDFNVRLNDAHKTGLGSSAALVTALTAALLAFYLPDTSQALPKKVVHNLAQAAHCSAQGKIGSGFDVAAAVHGSCIYRRFSPAVLERIGDSQTSAFATRLATVVDDAGPEPIWDVSIFPSVVTLPNTLRLVMCDVECGSETPSLVRKVLAWRKSKPEEALLLWETLQQANEAVGTELQALADEPGRGTNGLKTAILTVRSLLREMSQKADVPIEPKTQTALLDACSARKGVIGGVVPGAGGYDAITLLVENDPKVLEDLRIFLKGYKTDVDDVSIGRVRLLGVKEEFEGIREENLDLYKGWLGS